MCLYPTLIRNKKYESNKKNNHNPPICKDKRLLYVTAACGKCYECRKQKARQWQIRMSEEIRDNNNGIFVTLTMSDDSLIEIKNKYNIKEDNEIATKAVRLFLERVRKNNKGKSIKHWLITEKGHEGSKRIHLHGIIWAENGKKIVEENWKYGFTFIGSYVNEASANYITKYITKTDLDNKDFIGKVLCSPGIGKGYTERKDSENNKFKGKETNESYRLRNGTKLNLPIYYRNKLLTEDEKEKLWIQKQEKGIVYVCGDEVDINNHEAYNRLMEYHRKRCAEIDKQDHKRWEKEKYLKKLKKQRKYIREASGG